MSPIRRDRDEGGGEGKGETSGVVGRRGRARQPRDKRVGPLLFDEPEFAALVLAAEREGLSVGAFIADTAVAAARQQLHPIPLNYREQMTEFVRARVVLNQLGNALTELARSEQPDAPALKAVAQRIDRTIQRIEDVADAFDVPGPAW
ncbi:hypothetical protein ACQPYK_49830 (plasmid) [Streptosporangium sp. CA-135522]|uniref:hypothetical protein n=1 Tax=Streptosporangium sp. CA-135522 TaxID=3240072 RepID=UPI003D8CFF60